MKAIEGWSRGATVPPVATESPVAAESLVALVRPLALGRSRVCWRARVGDAWQAATIGVVLSLSLSLLACSRGEPTELPAVDASDVATDAEPAPPHPAVEALVPEEADPLHAPRTLLPAPIARLVREGEGGATVGRDASVIVAGEMRLEIREGSSKTEQIITIQTMTPEGLERPLPTGFLVGAGRGTPHEPQLVPVARWFIPLRYDLSPGTTLEVLGWNPHLNSWAVLGDARVNEEGTHAVFLTMMLGDVVLRVKPVRDDAVVALCSDPNFKFKEEWPSGESNAVGLTPVEHRVARLDAFAYMADFRVHQSFGNVSIKNEEIVGAWHRNAIRGQSYKDEDYLMDPNAESALTLLQELVAREWYDPYTGEPAMQIRLTEAYDSMVEHSQQSTHYQGRGIDLTLTPVPAPGPASRRFWYGRLARLSVCAGFDYVFYENNLHVHASVLPTKVAVLVVDETDTFSVLYGDLWAPQRWVRHPFTWKADELMPTSLAWTKNRELEVRASTGADALVLGLDTTVAERKPATSVEAIRATQTGLQAFRVIDGALYYVNTIDAPKLGSGTSTDDLLALDGFSQVPVASNLRVIDAVFRPHVNSQGAWERYGGLH